MDKRSQLYFDYVSQLRESETEKMVRGDEESVLGLAITIFVVATVVLGLIIFGLTKFVIGVLS